MLERSWIHKVWLGSTTVLTIVLFVGCGPDNTPPNTAHVDDGLPELYQPLTTLASPCTFVPSTGVATVTIASGETAVVSRRPSDGAIVTNTVPCSTATSANLKRLNVVENAGNPGNETLIIDFLNGSYAPGITNVVGITIDMGTGTDALKFRGTTLVDTFTLGDAGISTEHPRLT